MMTFASALAFFLPMPAEGAGGIREIRFGVLHHDTDGLWSGSRREHGPDLNAEIILDMPVRVGRLTLHPAIGTTVNTRGDTSKLYACARWEHAWSRGWFVALGFGGAWHDGHRHLNRPDRKALGSRWLFHTSAEAGRWFSSRHSISVYFDHVSNAGFADENEGMDTLGLRYGVRF